MSYKLGITPASELPWEFSARIRPWFQPLVYFLIAKPLMVAGPQGHVRHRLCPAAGDRAVFACWRWRCSPARCCPPSKARKNSAPLSAICRCSAFCLTCSCAPSSETFSAAFFALGLAVALGAKSARGWRWQACCAGWRLRAATRPACWAWACLPGWRSSRVRASGAGGVSSAGGLVALAIGALADRWGYGQLVFPPLGYVDVNLVQGVAAHQFGREPVFAYLYLLPAQIFFAITLVLMAAWWRCGCAIPAMPSPGRRLPFVLAHVAVAHKEARFLFPLAILATAFPVLGFSPRLPLLARDVRAPLAMAHSHGRRRSSPAFRCWRWSISRSIPLGCGRTCRWPAIFTAMIRARFTALLRPSSPIPCTGRTAFKSRKLKDAAQLRRCWTRVRSF